MIAKLIDERLATKGDLAALRSDIKADIKVEIAEAKAETIKWMFGTIGFQTLVILGAVAALAKLAHG